VDYSKAEGAGLVGADLVGHYRIVATLGSGGMGVVSKAIDTRLNRPVALKAIRESDPQNTDAVLRLRAEALAAASLDHPYICKIYELLETGSATIVVMEFVEGETLGDILDRRVPPLVDTLRYGSEIAEGLANAHARNIVHRDVKPSNVMVTPHGHIKLLDFGIARNNSDLALTQSGLTLPGNIPGTPQYMSPEQALGRPLDGRADLFSLGILLFRCLTGQLPFEGATRDQYIQQMLAGRVRPLDPLAPEAPGPVRDIVKACLQLDPDKRPHTAGVVAETLRRAAEALSTSTLPIASKDAPRAPQWVAWSVIAALVAGALIFAGTRYRSAPAATPVARALVPAVTWPSSEQGARISPDGRWLSFVSDRQNQSRVFVQAIDRGEPVPVTIQGSAVSHAWSPDSRELAVLVRQGQSQFVMIVPAFFGGSPRVSIPIDSGFTNVAVLRWVGDGVYLDANRGQAGRSLLRAAVSSLQVQDASARWPQELRFRTVDVSPDGRRVVVSASAGGVTDLLTAAIDGSQIQRLTKDEYTDGSPLWIDDRTIVFESNRGGQLDLWELSTETNRATQLTSSQMREAATGASADGGVVSFEQTTNQVNLWRLDLAGSTLTQLTADSLSDFWPSASATGRVMAFQRTKPTPIEGFQFLDSSILVAPLQRRSLEPQAVQEDGFAARLSADGGWVAFYQRIPDRRHLRLVARNLATGGRRELSDYCVLPSMTATSLPVDFVEQNVTWSVSGSTLYFIVAGQNGHEIQAVDLASSRPPATVVSAGPGAEMWDVRLSPDGSKLAFAVRFRREAGAPLQNEIRVHDLAPNRTTALLSVQQGQMPVKVPGWSRNDAIIVHRTVPRPEQLFELELMELTLDGGRRVVRTISDSVIPAVRIDSGRGRLFVTRNIEGIHNLFTVSLRDGVQRQVTANHAPGVSFSGIQPLQDDSIVFAREEWKRDIWLLTTGARANDGAQDRR
jgi:serine/threonine protein kinase/Tol biopolymer transport system component